VARARADAPLAAATLGRIVSSRDFEDFARAFTGIAKVAAAPVGGLHLTVAGEGGAAVVPGSALYRNLVEALELRRVPGPPVRVDSYQPLPFRLAAKLLIDPRFRPERVFADATAALAAAFSFESQELGGDLDASTVIAVLQGVSGVLAVDLDALYLQGSPPGLASRLAARRARFENGRIQPAQLLVLDTAGVMLGSRTP
ncbi:MAG TPA: putative baseplate assembly protein, partial [Thermoanaerobaculia bacterium]|nr:putative baseplate assembly protein [Thermoanaerobaculia bacterium]